jgi:hypothetical protein
MKTWTMSRWEELNIHLQKESKQICADNDCTEENHNCESYAYFDETGLATICLPDYCQRRYPVALALPWCGSNEDLKNEVLNQLAENEEE